MIAKLREWRIVERLPLGGVLAFSLCSTWSLYNLLTYYARHPTPLFWLPAILVEVVTAWAVSQSVKMAREVTKSNISKQDRRFHTIMLVLFGLVALPLLVTSVWANWREFGNGLLAVMFPVASIGCAIGATLPQVVSSYHRRRQAERQEGKQQRKEQRKRAQVVGHLDGTPAAILRAYMDNPDWTQARVGQELGISRQAVSQHLVKLEASGLVKRNGKGVEVLWKS